MAAAPVPVPRQRDLLLILLSLAAAVQLAVATAPPPRAYPGLPLLPLRLVPAPLHRLHPPSRAGALTGAACGYGPAAAAEIAADGGFHIAAVSAGLFRRGQACGACYQLRCRGHAACGKDGVKVVVVSHVPETATNGTGRARFLLTDDAFAAMVHTPGNGGGRLAGPGPAVDVDFRRIPCVYRDKNLSVRVEEASARGLGHSLALRFLYQGGQTAIAAVEVAQAEVDGANANDGAAPSQTTWRYMTRSEGSPAVWRTSRAPPGPLRLRIVVAAGSGGKWLRSDGAVLPADWVPGAVYDTGLRVADVAASTCGGASCDSDDEDGDEELR